MKQNWCKNSPQPIGSEAFRGNALELAFGKFAENRDTPQAKMVRAKNRINAQNKAFADAVRSEALERMKVPFYAGMSYQDVRALVLLDIKNGTTSI